MSEDLQIQGFAGFFYFRPVFNIYKSSQNERCRIGALSGALKSAPETVKIPYITGVNEINDLIWQ